ncbi:MAG: DUF2950 domain-containing protein [Terracidiphilus sp.]
MWFKRSSNESLRDAAGSVATFAFVAACLGLGSIPAAGQSTPPPPVASGHTSASHRSAEVPAGQQAFSSATEASETLVAALKNDDQQSLLKVLGPGSEEILSSGDETEDKQNKEQFVQKYQQMHRLITEPDGTTTLYIGAENWPTPIPLVHRANTWHFDTAAGKQEILYRRVGDNELTVIQVCHELVDAEKEYDAQPHDGDSERQYAQRILSNSGKQNGLYWKAGPGEANSPLGPLVASAEREGYAEDGDQKSQPFHGYYFRVLKGQEANAHGKAESYVVDGKMTRGFAFLAYPAEYRSSGVMTFLVDQNGIVYEKDLGRRTAEITKSIVEYDRNPTWRKAD